MQHSVNNIQINLILVFSPQVTQKMLQNLCIPCVYLIQLELQQNKKKKQKNHHTHKKNPRNQTPGLNTMMPWNFRFLSQRRPCNAQENLPRTQCFGNNPYYETFTSLMFFTDMESMLHCTK